MRVWAIVATALRRFLRDRFNLFFVFVLPLAIVLLIGLQFGDDAPTPTMGVAAPDTPIAAAVVANLEARDRLEVRHLELGADTRQDATQQVEDGELEAALVIPADFDAAVNDGVAVTVSIVTSPFGVGPQLRSVAGDALAAALAIPTATAAAVDRGADASDAAAAAEARAGLLDLIEVSTITTGDRLFPEDTSGYDIGAAGQLVLFVFLTSLTGSAAIIQSRRLGVASRMMSTPTSVRTIIAGEAVARFAIAAAQGIYIMVASTVLFGVGWGNLLASAAILATFAAVGAAAAMLSGAFFQNDEQASGITVVVALGLGALGGSMLPVELFSDTMLTIARAIPHFWALDAFAEVVRRDATVADVLPQLGVLAGFAVAIGALATWQMRRTLVQR
jgi:ABC-2 type transport system permease protein